MKKTLLCIAAFIGTFFGLFIIINALVVVIFPVSWNDVVTCPAWLVVYFVIGIVTSIMVVEELNSNL